MNFRSLKFMGLTTLLLALSSPAFAAGNDFLVKVSSAPCNNKKNSKVGSGNLIRHEGKLFVLTSDHVLFHGNNAQNICHRILFRGNALDADLVTVSSMEGLALLKPLNTTGMDSVAMDTSLWFHNQKAPTSGFASLLGFPSGSLTPAVDASAQILNKRSSRKILPRIQNVIEVKGHSEYGMSGGALLNHQGKFIGLLSHQYLQLNLGAPSTVKNYEEGKSSGELIALVIPLEEIENWISAALEQQKWTEFRFDVASQIKRSESLVVEGVRFTVMNCKEGSGAVGGEGAGIGGRLKGGDGAGIGGNGNEAPAVCKIVITWNRDASAWNNQWPLARAAWFEQLKEKLLSGASAEMTGLYQQGERVELAPLVQIFSQIQKGAIPLIRLETPFNADTESVQQMRHASEQAKAQIGKLFSARIEYQDSIELLKEIGLMLESVDNAQWEIAFDRDITQMLRSEAWNELLQKDFNACVALKSALLKMQSELKKVRI